MGDEWEVVSLTQQTTALMKSAACDKYQKISNVGKIMLERKPGKKKQIY